MAKASRQKPKPSVAVSKVEEISIEDTDSGRELMKAVLAKPRKSGTTSVTETKRINGVVIGTLAGQAEDAHPLVNYPGMPSAEPLAAITTQVLGETENGHEVALSFVGGDPALPIVLGLIQKPGETQSVAPPSRATDQKVDVEIDGDRLTLSADREIVLQCGKSSITLTRAGKVILKGAYLSTNASGVNRIKGGSVQIN